MTSRVSTVAYRWVDPEQPCPTCKAAPNVWCVNPVTGQTRRVPCLKRPRIPGVMPTPTFDTEVVHVDFAQPRHERTV